MMDSTTRPEDLSACVHDAMQRWTVPGLALGIVHNGQVETHSYGVTSLETGQPVRPDTLFQVGSISKVFCATLVMQLVDEGLVDLDTPIKTYLPDLVLQDATAQATITLRHLLTHTSGLFGDDFSDFGMGDDALAKAVASYRELRQLTAPGELWTYCNTGFNLAGAVVERVLGQPFEAAMDERVIEPLELERSFYFAHQAIAYPVAVGHTQKDPASDEHEVARKYPLPRCVSPAGGVISTVGDLLRFARFHMEALAAGQGARRDRPVLSEGSRRAMQERQTGAANWATDWGIGWHIPLLGTHTTIGHNGSTNGFQSLLTLVPERGFAIALLTNSGRGSAANRDISEWALQHYCGITQPEYERRSLPPEELGRFAGLYRQPHAEISVVVEGSGLRADVTSRSPLTDTEAQLPPALLAAIGEREFLITNGVSEGQRVDFILGEGRAVRFIRMSGRLADRVIN